MHDSLAYRRRWFGTSWKMNKTIAEAEAYIGELLETALPSDATTFVIPPFTALDAVRRAIGDAAPNPASLALGAQNMHWRDEGAGTGEISAGMLKACGVQMVELGHSERRAAFGETDGTVNLKVKAALRHGLIPLVCVGDTREEFSAGASAETVLRQVKLAFFEVADTDRARCLLAYEPVWAIGESGEAASPAHVATVHAALRTLLGDPDRGGMKLLYGGSVNVDNAGQLARVDGVDGLFVGRAAWSAPGFRAVLKAAYGYWMV